MRIGDPSFQWVEVIGGAVALPSLTISFRPKDKGEDPPDDGAPPGGGHGRNAEVDFRGERRSNETHASTTDPDARLFRKSRGTGAVLCFMGHALMENRSELVVNAELTRAAGTAERLAALAMLEGAREARPLATPHSGIPCWISLPRR